MDNFKFGTTPPPVEAYHFDSAVPVTYAPAEDGKKKLKGQCYSGEVVTKHSFWPAVVFDLSSTKAADRTPILINHDPDKRAGHCSVGIGTEISFEGQFLSNEYGTSAKKDMDEGFPWQMSVFIQPGTIEEVAPGAKVTVNGREVVGPCYIFKNALIREVSLTPTGADDKTYAVAASATATGHAPQMEAQDMDKLDQLTAQVAELNTKFAALTKESDDTKVALAEVTKRAETAEKALADKAKADRFSTLKGVYAELGRKEPAMADVAHYLDMPEATFSAVVADLKASKPQAPDFLFKAQADDGKDKQGDHQTTIDRLAAL